MKAWLPLTLAFALTGAAHAQSDCTYPAAPSPPPDGATATLDQMKAAAKEYGRYNGDMNDYLACLRSAADAATPKDMSKLSPDEKKKAQDKLNFIGQKNDAAVEELQTTVGRFNEQLKIYKAKQQKP